MIRPEEEDHSATAESARSPSAIASFIESPPPPQSSAPILPLSGGYRNSPSPQRPSVRRYREFLQQLVVISVVNSKIGLPPPWYKAASDLLEAPFQDQNGERVGLGQVLALMRELILQADQGGR